MMLFCNLFIERPSYEVILVQIHIISQPVSVMSNEYTYI